MDTLHVSYFTFLLILSSGFEPNLTNINFLFDLLHHLCLVVFFSAAADMFLFALTEQR